MIPEDIHPDPEEIIKRRLTTPMQALQAAYELLQAHYYDKAFSADGEAGELTARVMTDLWMLATTQLEAK